MSSSKIIEGRDSGSVEQWKPPSVDDGVSLGNASPMTAKQLEAVQKQAYEEGFEQGKTEGFTYGHNEGLEEGRAQIQRYLKQFDALIHTLESPLNVLDDQVEQSLVELIISMVRQLVRREVKTDPGQIIGVVREALAILPISSRNVRVMLHPDDADLVRKVYEVGDNEMGWEIVEDPLLARGGCRVVTETSQVDATLESRLATLIAPLLGDERENDTTPENEDGN